MRSGLTIGGALLDFSPSQVGPTCLHSRSKNNPQISLERLPYTIRPLQETKCRSGSLATFPREMFLLSLQAKE